MRLGKRCQKVGEIQVAKEGGTSRARAGGETVMVYIKVEVWGRMRKNSKCFCFVVVSKGVNGALSLFSSPPIRGWGKWPAAAGGEGKGIARV